MADLLLWKRWDQSALVLVSATAFWYLFERAAYNPVSFAANVLFLLVLILFLWAKSASVLNRPLPPLPDLEVSEDSFIKAAESVRVYVNYGLSIASSITIGRSFILFAQVLFFLWVTSYIGSLANFLTLVYIGIILSLSVPVFFDKYQEQIDDKLSIACKFTEPHYKKIEGCILRKIPMDLNKNKKIQ